MFHDAAIILSASAKGNLLRKLFGLVQAINQIPQQRGIALLRAIGSLVTARDFQAIDQYQMSFLKKKNLFVFVTC